MPIFIRDTLTLSNRMAGPICRLQDTVKRIANGEEVPPLSFRKSDMWQDLPAQFNAMTEQLRKGAGGHVQKLPEELAESIGRSDAGELVNV